MIIHIGTLEIEVTIELTPTTRTAFPNRATGNPCGCGWKGGGE